MSLQHDIKRFQVEGLVEYFGRARGDSTIDERSVEKSCEYDDGYVSRQWICFEPRYCFISITGGHSEIHEDQIGTGRACLF